MAAPALSGSWWFDASTDLTTVPAPANLRLSEPTEQVLFSDQDLWSGAALDWSGVTVGQHLVLGPARTGVRSDWRIVAVAVVAGTVPGHLVDLELVDGDWPTLAANDPVLAVIGVVLDWTTIAEVKAALGLEPADTTDDGWLAQVVTAANAMCTRRRATAGYIDVPPLDPTAQLGAQLYAVSLYRERGAVDGFASMAELGTFVPTGGSWGQIQRLWGVNRPQVDRPDPARARSQW